MKDFLKKRIGKRGAGGGSKNLKFDLTRKSWLVENQYIAVGLSSPLSKSSFILFILGIFRTPKAR